MINLKDKDAGGFFLISAVGYFLANNLHWVVRAGIFARVFDIIATVALVGGILVWMAERKSEKSEK